jgi:glucose-1-phosphate cytidylyltransferase
MIEHFKKSGKIACYVCVKPSQSFHVVKLNDGGCVESINPVRNSDMLINGGYFIFRQEIFDYIGPGEELVEQPFQRLIKEGQIAGYQYDHFWCMDTFKEHQELTDMYNMGDAPWEVWRKPAQQAAV